MVRCPVCSLVHSHPPPVDRVRVKYVEQYDLAVHFEAFEARKRVLYERRLSRLPRPSPGENRLCDVGCADGQFLQLARLRGWDVFGVEMNPPAAARARGRGAFIFEGRLEELDALPWGTFDLVTCWDSLEHTPSPAPFVERLVRLLKEGGILALTTLNLHSLAWMVFGTRWSMVVDDHFTYWTARSLTRLLDRSGVRILDVDVFALGRDFVSALGRGRRAAGAAPAAADEGAGAGGWDVNAGVLRAEAVLNRVFRLVGGGVGLGVIAQKRASA
jgi:SAM-dependent methyltransferase